MQRRAHGRRSSATPRTSSARRARRPLPALDAARRRATEAAGASRAPSPAPSRATARRCATSTSSYADNVYGYVAQHRARRARGRGRHAARVREADDGPPQVRAARGARSRPGCCAWPTTPRSTTAPPARRSRSKRSASADERADDGSTATLAVVWRGARGAARGAARRRRPAPRRRPHARRDRRAARPHRELDPRPAPPRSPRASSRSCGGSSARPVTARRAHARRRLTATAHEIATSAPAPTDSRIACGMRKSRMTRASGPIRLPSMRVPDEAQLRAVEDDRVLDLGAVDLDVGADRRVGARRRRS